MALFKKATATAAGKKPSASPIFVAEDVMDSSSPNKVRYTKEQVAEAIKGYAEGKQLSDQGGNLMDSHKPVLAEFARTKFAQLWSASGTRPKSPKLTTKADGTGTIITMSFIDKASVMNDDAYAQLEGCIGVDKAIDCVQRFTQYTIDGQIASERVTIDGKEDTFQNHIEAAMLKYFPENLHSKLGDMLKPKEVFTTKKGLLDRLLDLVGRGQAGAATKLAEALVKAKIIVSYKAGAVADEE